MAAILRRLVAPAVQACRRVKTGPGIRHMTESVHGFPSPAACLPSSLEALSASLSSYSRPARWNFVQFSKMITP